jgi:hypothetical protein
MRRTTSSTSASAPPAWNISTRVFALLSPAWSGAIRNANGADAVGATRATRASVSRRGTSKPGN